MYVASRDCGMSGKTRCVAYAQGHDFNRAPTERVGGMAESLRSGGLRRRGSTMQFPGIFTALLLIPL